MNELQQVLLVFAVIVVVGLYFFSRQRSQKNRVNDESATKETRKQPFAEELVPPTMPKEPMATQSETDVPISESSANTPPHLQGKTQEELDFESRQQLLAFEDVPVPSKPKIHKVIEIDDLELVDERFVGRYQSSTPPAQPKRTDYSVKQPPVKPHSSAAIEPAPQPDPQIFAILVLFTQTDMSVNRLMSHLKIFGLVYDERGIYVKKSGDRTIVKVANVMEPGLFPAEPDETMKTPGIALILELPSVIPAPGAMEELIMTARRISQALEGRMYDMQRHLLRESDIQAMREAALDYQTTKL
jgi:cell division protein ZipA